MNPADPPAVVIARGPRACESRLDRSLSESLAALGPEVLIRPLYLLVPSHSLRNHLLTRLAQRHTALTGVGCFTLRSLALEVLERCGEAPTPGAWMLPVLVRRAARRHPPLSSCLDHLRNGYDTLVGTIVDLLEAGLDPAHAAALDEILAEEGRLVASVGEVQRARSLVRVATEVLEQMEVLGIAHVSAVLSRATELLRTRQEAILPCSEFHVYGFADATGIATDLIEAVLLRFGGTVYLDQPPDPVHPELPDSSIEFGRRFATRLTDLGRLQSPEPESEPDRPEIELITALGAQTEVREIGWQIRRLLDSGQSPEGIGIVARQIEPYRNALRTHLGRLGIPFSAARAAGPLLPVGRRLHALLEMLERRQQVRLERWLDARADTGARTEDFDLRLAMFGLGVGRLEELAGLPIEDILTGDSYALPVRLGFASAEADGTTVLPRRFVPKAELLRSRDQAAEICHLFDSWTSCRSLPDHRDHLDRLLARLGWQSPQPAWAEVQRTVERLIQGVDDVVELDREEFLLVVRQALAGTGTDKLGGEGGGVQILDVIEARGRTFDHLFVLGLNKGVFPRTVREDAAFPDSLRAVLGREGHGILPDLARKRSGFAEERFLFAQLCAASPRISLSWQTADDDQRERNPSPLVERLLWTKVPRRARSPLGADSEGESGDRPRTLYESAIRAGLAGQSRQLKAALIAAQPPDLSPPPRIVASGRLGVVGELDRPPGEGSRLGPYFGLLGAAEDPADPRLAQDLYVTTLERFATCPWQTFLGRLLRLEALPDPVDILPALDPLLTGQVVHRVLERLTADNLEAPPSDLDAARAALPGESRWPEPAALERRVLREARSVANSQGIAWPGFAAVLARLTLPFLEQARDLAWRESGDARPVAVELAGSLPLSATENGRRLHFLADRVDLQSGGLLLSDFKTGRSAISRAAREETRSRHLLGLIRQGRWLQAAAYAFAAGGPNDRGRYLFVHPDFNGPEGTRIVMIPADNAAAREAFATAVDTILEAWLAGTFFPRLVEVDSDQQPGACEYCSVAEACLRGDSAARGRLRDWTARRQGTSPTEDVFLRSWWMATKKEKAT